MSANSRLSLAIHALTWLARRVRAQEEYPEFATSQEIANSVNTNPVILRELLGLLEKQRIVCVQRGSNAGWKLTRQPEEITLLDVYRAVQEPTLFALHHTPPNPRCTIGFGIKPVLQDVYANAQQALEQELAQTTIADVLRDTLATTSSALAQANDPAKVES